VLEKHFLLLGLLLFFIFFKIRPIFQILGFDILLPVSLEKIFSFVDAFHVLLQYSDIDPVRIQDRRTNSRLVSNIAINNIIIVFSKSVFLRLHIYHIAVGCLLQVLLLPLLGITDIKKSKSEFFIKGSNRGDF